VFSRVDNNGKSISDSNDRFRSEKICKELTEKYGLYFAKGKENVKEHRLKEPDKTKYEIYRALKAARARCRSWQELERELIKAGIATEFRSNGDTDKIQGVKFPKNGYSFNGSKIDRECSYSKIDSQLRENNRQQQYGNRYPQGQHLQSDHHISKEVSPRAETIISAMGGFLDLLPNQNITACDADQAEYLRQQSLKRRKKTEEEVIIKMFTKDCSIKICLKKCVIGKLQKVNYSSPPLKCYSPFKN
jgi:hypothetical protein